MVVVAVCEWFEYESTAPPLLTHRCSKATTVVTEDLPCTQIRRRTDSVTNRRIFFLRKTHEAN